MYEGCREGYYVFDSVQVFALGILGIFGVRGTEDSHTIAHTVTGGPCALRHFPLFAGLALFFFKAPFCTAYEVTVILY